MALVNPLGMHGSGASSSADSTTNSSESINNARLSPLSQGRASPGMHKMASKMPTNFMDRLPASARRRLVHSADQNGLPKRTAIALGASGYRRPNWSASQEEAAKEDSPHSTVVAVNSDKAQEQTDCFQKGCLVSSMPLPANI